MVTKFVVAERPGWLQLGRGLQETSHAQPPRSPAAMLRQYSSHNADTVDTGEGEIRCQTCRYRADTLAMLVPAAFLETELQQPARRVRSDGEPSRYIVPKLHRTGSFLYPPGGSSMLGSNQHCACPDSLLTVAKSDPILPPSCEDRRLGRTVGPVS